MRIAMEFPKLGWLAVLFPVLAAPATSQESGAPAEPPTQVEPGESSQIRSLQVEGLSRVKEPEFLEVLGIHEGSDYDAELVGAGILRAWEEFHVRVDGIDMRPVADGVDLRVRVTELPLDRAPGAAPSGGRTGPLVEYTIHAAVDGDAKTLTGRETIVWRNETQDTVRDAWFHLYLNAFANNRSLHLREAWGSLRGGHKLKDGWGWQRVESVRVGGVEVVDTLRPEHPDEREGADSEDRTVVSIELPEPVGPGQSIEIVLEWTSQLPRVRRRTGYKGDFLFVAQWFPKLGVYEQGKGWNCHQFHANSEFFGDYGTYDVTLDLPKRYEGKVGGSGRLVSTTPVGSDRIEVRFLAPTERDRVYVDATGKRPLVHDFTWTADPTYEVYENKFTYEDWATRFPKDVAAAQQALGPDKDLALRPVDVTVLIHPERKAQAERHFKATCAALFFYGLWFGEYPYEHITVVDPAWGARAAGGMEYPTLFTAGTSLFTKEHMHSPEGVTVHECGHQFWYGLVGNNEFEAAWLDEGFNSYTDSEVLARVYGPRVQVTEYGGLFMDGVRPAAMPASTGVGGVLGARSWKIPGTDIDLRPLPRNGFVDWWRDQPYLTLVPEKDDPRQHDRQRYLRDPDSDPIDTDAWKYVDRLSYTTNSYPRTAVALRSLIGVIGFDAWLAGMRHYSEKWRYGHPYPEDFFAAFLEGSGTDVGWYFDDLFRSTKTVDWQVQVRQRRLPEPMGFFPEEGTGVFAARNLDAEVLDDDEEEKHERAVLASEASDERPFRSEVVVRRKGELRLPLTVRLTWADGTTEDVVWSREDQEHQTWLRIEHVKERRLKSVILDPARLYYLDKDMADNQWFDDEDSVAPWRWAERVFNQYAHLLQWQSGIGG